MRGGWGASGDDKVGMEGRRWKKNKRRRGGRGTGTIISPPLSKKKYMQSGNRRGIKKGRGQWGGKIGKKRRRS